MLITFSRSGNAGVPLNWISGPLKLAQAIDRDVCAETTWKRPNQARLTLRILATDAPASTKTHEAFIKAILDLDPAAAIKTARAVYRGKADYDRQHGLTRIKA